MKNISLIAAISFLFICMPLLSQQSENSYILESMTFPAAEIKFGRKLNDPFFALNIQKKYVDNEEIKRRILTIEKGLNERGDPDLYFQLGNCFRELNDIGNAVTAYNKYIELTSSEDIISLEDFKRMMNTGVAYYSLSEIDLRKRRSDNLEKALLYFTRAAEMNPDDAAVWIILGDCYLKTDKTTEALYCYNKTAEKNAMDFQIYARLQAASFQGDFLKLSKSIADEKIETVPDIQGFNFDYIETAINNSPAGIKEILKLQHYVYLLRLKILNDEYIRNHTKNIPDTKKTWSINQNDKIITETETLVKSLRDKSIDNESAEYLSGMISFLKEDYKIAVSDFNRVLKSEKNQKQVYDDILFINLKIIKDYNEVKKNIENAITADPEERYYLIMAEIEFKNKNYSKAEMLCLQSLKINTDYTEAYSGLSVVYAASGNYLAADEMIKKGNSIIKKHKHQKQLHIEMKVNEAAAALLKNEKERAYILLRSVLSVDNNDKAHKLYSRYFIKK